MRILPGVNGHDDLVRLTDQEKIELCAEIREFLIDSVSKTGGHLAGNLGIVELSVALETVYNTEKDRLLFDVGHQSYVHKILTGRRAQFSGLRQFGGLSGFPKPDESVTDAFVAGHASSSVSIALGMARARSLQRRDYQVAVVIGDGATTGGMAYEGMNNAADSREPLVVVLNDNKMSIAKNVGGIFRHLSRIRSSENYVGTKRRYQRIMFRIPGGRAVYHFSSRAKNRIKRFLLPTTIFENMGFRYLGPVDGHDVLELISVLRVARDMQEPVLVHVVTQKGRGYGPAEEDPARFHGIGKFDSLTGKTLAAPETTFSDTFGATMLQLAEYNPKVCAITAAMPGGTGLNAFMKTYPKRLFDVGIAEEHAVSMAGGLAKQGMIPVVAIYSTFLQRAFDQILEDVALLHLHVVFAVDRAGLVGDDGPTHHGVFDVGYLRQVPGMKLLAPASLLELKQMLTWAVEDGEGPIAVRYPRGTEGEYAESAWNPSESVILHRTGTNVALITYGVTINSVLRAADMLAEQDISCTVLRLPELSVIPAEDIAEKLAGIKTVVVVEETAANSGIHQELAWKLNQSETKFRICGIHLGQCFVTHGDQKKLYELCGMDADSIVQSVNEVLRHEK